MAYTFGQASQKINQSPVDVEPALDASSTPTGYTFGKASQNINKVTPPTPPQVSTGRKTAEILAPSTTAFSDYVRASSRLKSGEIDFMQKEREALISSKDPKAKTRINEIDTEIAKVIANADKTTGQKFGMAIGTGIEMSGVAELAALGGAVGRYGVRKVLGKAATEVAPKDVYTPFAGSKAANFITKATTIAPKTATEEAAYKASSLGSKAKVIAKDTAKLMPESVGFGYGYDVSMGLQEGEGTESLKPGAMTAIGAALPVAIGGTRLAKNAVVPSKAKAIDSLEQTYADLMSGTTPGKKKISKIEKKTEMMDKAGTTGKTPMRTLAEGGIIPKRNGPKLDTFDQAEEYRSGITYLKDANKQALEEVGLSSQLTKLDDLEASAIKYANSQRNIDSGRAPKMVKEIQKEFDYLREAYPEGVIPVGKVDEIKSARWDNVFGNKGLIDADVLKKDSEYAIAKAMQKHIEEIADVAGNPEVAQLNREIGDRLEAAKFLEDLNGKTIKGGRLLKYMTTGIGATLGNTVPGKIIGALGGNLAGEIIIATNISGPMKRLILRNLSKQDPAAYTKTIEWLSKQKLDRETRLLLPAPKTTMMGGTDIKGNKILPSGQKVAKPLEFLPQSKSPNNAQTTKAISNEAIMPDSIPLTKNTVKEDIVDNLDHLSEKDKSIVEKWLNSNPDETERQLYKAAKDFDDYINAQYDQGIDRYNGVIKYIEGGAKNKDGVLPEMGVTSGKNSNGRKMREFVTVKDKDGKYIKKEANPLKFQKRGDTFIEELGFNDKEEAQDFIDYFRKIIEQRDISKKDLASFTNPALKNSYGAVAGIQVDEDGNVTFSPEMAAIGMIGGHLAPKMNLFKEAKGSTLANFLKVAKTVAGKSEDELKRLWENANKGGLGKAKILQKGTKHDKDLAKALSESKGMSADDIMAKNPDIQLKRDVVATDLDGKKITIPEGEALTPYEMKGGKVVLQDGETYVVSKNQYQNIKSNAVTGEKPKPFAPELAGTEETVKGGQEERQKLLNKIGAGETLTDLEKNKLEKLSKTEQTTPTTYHSYTLPGGKNYKEILIKAPTAKEAKISYNMEEYDKFPPEVTKVFEKSADDSEKAVRGLEKLGYTVDYEPGAFDINGFYKSTKEAPIFKSSHWEDPNVLSHVRMAEHTYNGKKVTFLEEIQSDWAREGRAKGFIGDTKLSIKENDGYWEISDQNGKVLEKSSLANTKEQALKEATNNLGIDKGVPNHPLLKNWQEMSIKRALKEAVDNDAEYFAWINGEQTSARYNLATYVDNVKWNKVYGNKVPNTVIDLEKKGGGTIDIRIDNEGKIKQSLSEPSWNGKQLDEVLGKGLADKIMADESGKLSGDGLKFGGEWANALYDRQVPNIVKDLTGAKVETLDMGLPVRGKSTNDVNWVDLSNGKVVKPEGLKKGMEISGNPNASEGQKWIITDITGEGKFKAVPKVILNQANSKDVVNVNGLVDNISTQVGRENFYKRHGKLPDRYFQEEIAKKTESFDISTPKSQGQMGIKLTPEIKAMIRGEAPQIKKSSGKSPFELPKPKVTPLEQEAKGKTLDEFVKAQGKTVYHGTNFADDIEKGGFNADRKMKENSPFLGDDYVNGTYFTRNKKLFDEGGSLDNVGSVLEAQLPKNIKLLKVNSPKDLEDIVRDKYNRKTLPPTEEYHQETVRMLTEDLQSMGYDGVEIPSSDELIIFNPTSIKTKSQLTDIWKKANNKVDIKPFKAKEPRGGNVKFGKNFKKSAFGLAGLAALGSANQKASADTSDIKFGEKDIKETKIRMGKYRYDRTQEPTMFDGDALLKAIANNETGTATIKDPYSFNKWSDPKAGPLSKYGKDLGKYQITSARLKEKSKQFLGRVVTEKEFLSSPELQDKFIERQILWLKNQGLTPEQILAVHRHGWGDLSKKAIERALNERKSYVDKAVSFIKENKKI